MRGLVFDIEEFGVFDGPGIRSVVFLKGCPLRCNWCHNPEGLTMKPQRMVNDSLCTHCGKCQCVCPSPPTCTACGHCVSVCPKHLIRISGKWMEPSQVAERIERNRTILEMNGGGITFSGGEALMQPEFVLEVLDLLPGLHAAIETSGYSSHEIFEKVIRRMDLVLYDIKHTDSKVHKDYTGVDNALIHENLNKLIRLGIPFIARIPFIPGVNDDEKNMQETANWLKQAKNLMQVELLQYNGAAGAKYSQLGMTYSPLFDTKIQPTIHVQPFRDIGIKVVLL